MTKRNIRSLLLAVAAALFSLPAWASLSIATQPLFVTTAVPPNIVVILDNSGSMASAFVPDSLDDATSLVVYEYYGANTRVPVNTTTTTTASVNVTTSTINYGTVIVTTGVVNPGTLTITNGTPNTGTLGITPGTPNPGTLTITNGTPNNGTVNVTAGTPNSATVIATCVVSHHSCTGTYDYSCPTGYTLVGPSSGTSSTGSGSSCTQPTYNYSCTSPYSLVGSSSGTTSTPPSGTKCQQATYNYACASGFTRTGPASGTSSTGAGTSCSQPTYDYACTSPYSLVGPSHGTSSSGSGSSCQQPTYNYACATGFTRTGPASGTSSSGSGTTCSQQTYNYACSSPYTLNGTTPGLTNPAPSSVKCQQQTYSYSCPSGYTRGGPSSGTDPAGSSTTCTKSTTTTTNTYVCPADTTPSDTDNTNSALWCTGYMTESVQGEQSVMFKAAKYNPLAYDPTVTYSVPVKADGTLYTTCFTAFTLPDGTHCPGAYLNGFDTGRGSVDLSTNYRATVSYDPSSTSQTTNDCDGTFGTQTTGFHGTSNSPTSCHNNMGGVAAYYYVYDTAHTGCPTTPSTSDSRCYTKVTVGASEQQNFANWYSFYRTRNLTTVSGADLAFNQLSTTMRVAWIDLSGCTAFNSSCGDWAGNTFNNRIRQFSGTHRSDFFNWLSRLPADTSTPLRTALITAGTYFTTSGVNSPYAEQPQVSDGTEFVCRPNYAVMMTDGLWNSDSISTYNNQDNTAVTLPDGTPFAAGTHPFSDSTSNSLADIAFYYWKTNLRSDLGTTTSLQYMPYNKNATVVDSVNGTASIIPYWNPQNDPASWPHMNTFTVGLGLTTTITNPKWDTSTFNGLGYADVVTGHVAWPAVSSDSTNNVYDLWHAAINGRGQFFSADSPQDVAQAFNTIVSRITGRVGSSAAIAVNSTRLDSNTAIFQAQFNSTDWSGDVFSFKINSDGSIGDQQWQASALIPSSGSRTIVTWDDGNKVGVDFTWGTLTSNEQTALNTSDTGTVDNQGSDRLDYLRGIQTKEQGQSGGIYRTRTNLLGDIVNSNPLFVGTQNYGFNVLPGAEGTSYSAFASGKTSRVAVLVVGANDGMMHAFNGDTPDSHPNAGKEMFAFVPRGIYGHLSALTDPLYTHQYYVDGSPQSVDAYLASGWKTLVVGTTGAGGREIFLLDVTDPTTFSKTNVMWDYDGTLANDNDMGYSVPQPTIARMHDGNWYVIFGNGYNSPNAHAVLYMYRISDGTLLKFDTGVGTNNGMSAPNPVDYNGDRITDAIYAGDLQGNIWKLDVSSASSGSWKYNIYAASGSTPKPLFTAKDANNNVQPITDRPQVGLNSASQVMVFFGTGTYFLTGDNTVPASPPVQSFYGIIDDKGNLATDQVLKTTLLQQQIVSEKIVNGNNFRVTTAYSMTATNQGWYIDLLTPPSPGTAVGERVVSDAVLDNGRVIFTTVIPQGTACSYGGTSWLMELAIDNGGQLSVSPLDTSGDGKVDSNDYISVTYTDPKTNASVTVTVPVSGEQSNVGIIKTPGIIHAGNLEYKYFSGSTSKKEYLVESSGSSSNRMSWQQLQ